MGSSMTLKGNLDATRTLLAFPAEQVVAMCSNPRSTREAEDFQVSERNFGEADDIGLQLCNLVDD